MHYQIVGQLSPIYDMFGQNFTNYRSITLVRKKRPLSPGVLTGTAPLVKREFYSQTAEVAKLQYAHRSII